MASSQDASGAPGLRPEEARGSRDAPFPGLLALVAFRPEAAPSHGSPRLDGALASQERRPQGARRAPGDLRHHGRALHMGVLPDGWPPVERSGVVLDQRAAISRALPHLPLGLGGATAPPPPAMAEQLRDPGRVWHVRLPSGDGPDGLGMYDQECALACEQMGDRPPVHIRAVHGHLRTAGRRAPGGPRPQGGGQRPPRPARRAGLLPLGTGAAARHARLWVEGEPAALGSAHRQRPPPGVLSPHGLRVGGRSAAACWRRAQRQPVVPPRPPVLRLAGGRPEKLPPGGGRRSGAQPRPWHRPGRGAPS